MQCCDSVKVEGAPTQEPEHMLTEMAELETR